MPGKVRTVVTLVLVVFLGAVVLLALNGDYQKGVAVAHADAKRAVRLEVAVVNGDQGAVIDGEDVNLGQEYTGQLQSDDRCEWHLVPRGVAESGMQAGSYQLMVIIPADFSANLLSLEAEDPDEARVTYQVNSGNSQRVQALASAKGEEIVADLARQMTGTFVASILANLIQAQGNVSDVLGVESATSKAFDAKLVPQAKSFGQSLKTVTDAAGNSLAANKGAMSGIDGLKGLAEGTVTSAGSQVTSLQDLIGAVNSGNVTYGKFVKQLMGMNSALLAKQVKDQYSQLERLGGSLTEQFDASSKSQNLARELASLQALIKLDQRAIDARIAEVSGMDDAAILSAYGPGVIGQMDTDKDSRVSVREFFTYVQGRAASGPLTELTDRLAAYRQMYDSVQAKVRALIARLPYRSAEELDAAVTAGMFGQLDGQFAGKAAQIGDDLAAISGLPGYGEIPPDPGGVIGQDLPALAERLQAASQPVACPTPTPTASPEPEVTESPSAEPTATASTDPAADPSADPSAEPSGSPSPDPSESASPDPSDSPSPDPTDSPTPEPCWCPAGTDLGSAAGAYGAGVQSVADAYAMAASLAKQFLSFAPPSEAIWDLDVTGAVDQAITGAVRQSLADEQGSLASLRLRAGKLAIVAGGVETSAASLAESAETLNGNIAGQVKLWQSLKEQLAGVLTTEGQVSSSMSGTGAQISAIAAQAQGLTQSSKALVTSTQVSKDQAKATQDLLGQFAKDSKAVVAASGVLNKNSEAVRAQIARQLAGTKGFSQSFGQVLANSHDASVLNESLIDFLSHPVAGEEREPIASADVQLPFPWVIISFSLAWVIAWVLASLLVFKGKRSAYTRRHRQDWFGPNLRYLAITGGAGLVAGIVVAVLSAGDLGIGRESQLGWAALVVLCTLVFTLLAHWLIRQFKTAGIAVCILLLVSYVFVSNAVGGVTAPAGVSALVTSLSPLCRAESMMMAYLSGGAPPVAGYGLLACWILVLVALNLVIRKDLTRLIPARWRARFAQAES